MNPTLRRFIVAGLAVIAGVSLIIIALPQLWYPLWFDQGAFAACADALRRGGALYRDCWEVRGPAVILTYVIPMLISPSPVAIHVFDLLWQALTAMLLGLLAFRLYGRRSAIAAGVLYWLMYASINYWATAQAESFANLFFVLAVYAGWMAFGEIGEQRPENRYNQSRRIAWSAISGICVGVLFWFKYPFVLIGLVPLVLFLVRTAQRRRSQHAAGTSTQSPLTISIQFLLPYLLGGLAVLLVGLACFAVSDTIPSLQAQITYDITTFNNISLTDRLVWLRTIFWKEIVAFVSSGNMPTAGFKDTVTQLSILGRGYPFVFMLLVIGLISGIWRRSTRTATVYILGYVILVIAISIWLSHFYRYHFLIACPAITLIAAGGLVDWRSESGNERWRRIANLTSPVSYLFLVAASVGLVAAMLPWVRDAYDNVLVQQKTAAALDRESSLAPYSQLAAELSQRTVPSDRIVIFSDVPAVYVLTQRPNGTRFPYLRWAQEAGSAAIREQYTQEFLDDLIRNRAKFFVLTQTDYPWPGADFIGLFEFMTLIHAYIESNYHYIGVNGPFLIYELNKANDAR